MRKIEREVQATATRVESSFAKMGSTFGRFGKGLLVGAGIASISELSRTIQETISQASKIGDVADKLGLTTQQLQALQLGAVQADLTFEDLDKGLSKFSKTLGEAANGQGEYLKTLRANNVELKGTFFDNLKQLANLIKNAGNEQDQMLLATQAMGKGGGDFLEFLKNGGTGLEDLIALLEKSGSEIDDALIRKTQKIGDSWDRMWNSITNKSKTAVMTVVSDIEEAAGQAEGFFERISKAVEPADWNKKKGAVGKPDGPLPRTSTTSGILAPIPPVTKFVDPAAEAAAEKARKDAAEKAKRQAQAIKDVISALEFEQQQLQASELTQQINNELRQAGVTATSEQGKKIAALVTKNFELAQSEDLAREAGEKWLEAQEALRDSLQSLAELGLDAFGSWVEGGERAIDVVEDLAKQLAKAAVQAALFGQGPLAGLFGTTESGGGFSQLVKALGFAQGGIMTSRGKVPLRSYAGGGIAGSPQLAMFGEGSRPEAFVPLPDGKRIPVKMQMPDLSGFRSRGGGGVVVNVQNPPGMRTERRQRQEGGRTFVDIINSAVDDRLASGSTDKFFRAKYGFRPQLKNR